MNENTKPGGIPETHRSLWSNLETLLIAFDEILDRLDPPRLPEFIDKLKTPTEALDRAIAAAKDAPASQADSQGESAGDVLLRAANQALRAAEAFELARTGPHEIMKAYKALRPLTRAKEVLYQIASADASISRYFTHPALRENPRVLARLDAARNAEDQAPARGLLHFENQKGKRGGYSLYVPEYYDPEQKWPLVVGLHGGSGHGAEFLWSWLTAARGFGCILASPTSRDRTWSLSSPGIDAANLNKMLEQISETYNIDTQRLLLTGISDGGTYAVLLSIVHQSPFTHYAPVAAAVHVLLDKEGKVNAPVADKKYYQVHGARDWMFPVAHARRVSEAMRNAGALITYSEIEDLSHNYPRDENARILEWFDPELANI